MIHSYPPIYQLGHCVVKDIFSSPVIIQEKIDGSQISFGVYPNPAHPAVPDELRVRSRGSVINVDAPNGMFSKGVQVLKELAPKLHAGWTYRGEYLGKPKHNTLVYNRVPQNFIILYDIDRGLEDYLTYGEVCKEAGLLGFEVVPLLAVGDSTVLDQVTLRELLNTISVLGGQKIEGFVIKNYAMLGPDKRVLMAKFVSEEFKEAHSINWKQDNPTPVDIITRIAQAYGTPARWNKAIQHLREAGKITDSPKDIGPLIREIPNDVEKEAREEILEALWDYAWPHVRRQITKGFPEFYKEKLLQKQFGE